MPFQNSSQVALQIMKLTKIVACNFIKLDDAGDDDDDDVDDDQDDDNLPFPVTAVQQTLKNRNF